MADEQELVARAREGQVEAFAELAERYQLTLRPFLDQRGKCLQRSDILWGS